MKKRSEVRKRQVPAQTEVERAEEKTASAAKLLGLAKRFGSDARKERASSIDLSRLHELRAMKAFFEKFMGKRLPSALECDDATRLSFLKANALLDYCADAAEFQQESGNRQEAIEGWVIDSVKLQLEMLYVANLRLGEIHGRAVASRLEE